MVGKIGKILGSLIVISFLLLLISGSTLGEPSLLNMIASVEWSPDGSQIACSSDMGMVYVWNLSENGNAELYRTFDHSSQRLSRTYVSWHPDGNLLATGGDTELNIWDVKNDQIFFNASNYRSPRMIQWSPVGDEIAMIDFIYNESLSPQPSEGETYGEVYYQEQMIMVNPFAKTQINFTVADGAWNVTAFSWSPDGTKIIVGNNYYWSNFPPEKNNSGLRLWSFQGELLNFTQNKGYVGTVEWSPDGSTFVMGNGSSISFWNTTTLEKESEIFTESSSNTQWFPNSKSIVARGENYIEIWNRTTGVSLIQIKCTESGPIDLSPEGSKVAAATYDSKIYIWNTTSGKLMTTIDVPGAHGSLPSIETLPIVAIFVMCAFVMRVYSRRKRIMR